MMAQAPDNLSIGKDRIKPSTTIDISKQFNSSNFLRVDLSSQIKAWFKSVKKHLSRINRLLRPNHPIKMGVSSQYLRPYLILRNPLCNILNLLIKIRRHFFTNQCSSQAQTNLDTLMPSKASLKSILIVYWHGLTVRRSVLLLEMTKLRFMKKALNSLSLKLWSQWNPKNNCLRDYLRVYNISRVKRLCNFSNRLLTYSQRHMYRCSRLKLKNLLSIHLRDKLKMKRSILLLSYTTKLQLVI